MLVVKKNENGNLLCENENKLNYIKSLLSHVYSVDVFYINKIININFFDYFDKLVFVSFNFPLTIGLSHYTTVLKATTYTELFHELLPYANSYMIVENLEIRNGDCIFINIIPLERTEFNNAASNYLRKSTIDEILKEL